LILQFLDRVSDGRLGAVQVLGRSCITPLIHDPYEGGPLVQCNTGNWHKSIQSIGLIEITGFLIQIIDANWQPSNLPPGMARTNMKTSLQLNSSLHGAEGLAMGEESRTAALDAAGKRTGQLAA